MKKRFLPIAMTILLVMALIPFGGITLADSGEYTAYIAGQVDIDVSTAVEEWGIENLPDASTTVTIGEEATISMSFDEPIKFTGNWTGITIDIPIESDLHAGTTGAKILSFKTDGKDHGSRVVPIINRDGGGNLCIDIARQWGGDYDPYDLAGMEPFSSLEIIFIVPNEPSDTFTAFLEGQFDTDVNDEFPEWGLVTEDGRLAETEFVIGEEATISYKFDSPVKFTGNWTGITTNVWVIGRDSAASTNAKILSFVVDGEDLGSREVPLINRDGGGFLSFDIARVWGAEEYADGPYDAYGLTNMEPFTEIEITFIVENNPVQTVDPPPEMSDDFATSGNAWIGGTFLTDEGIFDWIPYEDQSVAFELGVPFTVTLDFGSDTQTHGEADWGFISVVQTDIMDSAINYDAFIESILVDGRSVFFDASVIEVGFDAGVRISLTNGWTDTPVVSGVNEIGTFSKLEVTMVFVAYGEENPFGDAGVVDEFTPPPSVEAITPPPARTDDDGGSSDSEGLPGWVIPVIIGAVVVVAVVVIVIITRGKKNSVSGS